MCSKIFDQKIDIQIIKLILEQLFGCEIHI